MSAISQMIKDCLTGIDGVTYDPWRIAALGSIVSMIGMAGYSAYQTHHFDAQAFGLGIAAILAGAGWGINQKKATEPQPQDAQQ